MRGEPTGMRALVRSAADNLRLKLLLCASVLRISRPFASGVFSMDEDSLSRDCEPFFESDGEEESTDGESSRADSN